MFLARSFCQTEPLNERKCPETGWMFNNVIVINSDDYVDKSRMNSYLLLNSKMVKAMKSISDLINDDNK